MNNFIHSCWEETSMKIVDNFFLYGKAKNALDTEHNWEFLVCVGAYDLVIQLTQ